MWQCVAQVHERTLQGDFLMALLKDILARRRAAGRPLKVSISSPRSPAHPSHPSLNSHSSNADAR